MGADKSIHPKDLPRPRKDADTKQAEEFVDKSNVRKDENDLPPTDQEKAAEGPRDRNQ